MLCRTSLQIRPLEKALSDHRIPFRTIRPETLFHHDPYRAFLDLIRTLLFPDNSVREYITPGAGITLSGLSGLSPPETLEDALRMFSDLSDPAPDPAAVSDMSAELSRYWEEGDGPVEFAEKARLGSGIDRYDPRVQAVSIMTIHASKGLEFALVFIPGCEDSIIPCTLTNEAARDEEEERRLLYVALTRAKGEAILSRAETRVIFGKKRIQPESPFLASIEEELLARRETEYRKTAKQKDDQLRLFE